jgi:hypothetical protein
MTLLRFADLGNNVDRSTMDWNAKGNAIVRLRHMTENHRIPKSGVVLQRLESGVACYDDLVGEINFD